VLADLYRDEWQSVPLTVALVEPAPRGGQLGRKAVTQERPAHQVVRPASTDAYLWTGLAARLAGQAGLDDPERRLLAERNGGVAWIPTPEAFAAEWSRADALPMAAPLPAADLNRALASADRVGIAG
jgi:hypothetical protein